jgi:capsular exopolysaccharide synthesis family protein
VPNEDTALELRDYLRVLRRWKWTIAIVVLLSVGVSIGMALREEPTYTAESQLLLARRLVDQLFIPNANAQGASPDAAARAQANEIAVIGTPRISEDVSKKLGRKPAAVAFVGEAGSDVISVKSTSTNPKLAADTVNAYAQTYIEVRTKLAVQQLQDASNEVQAQITQLDEKIALLDASLAADPGDGSSTDRRRNDRARFDGQRGALVSQLERLQTGITVAQNGGAEVLNVAQVPTEPTNQDLLRNIVAGLAVGLVLGVALAFLREYLDDTIKTKDDLERASGLTVLGLIPALPDWKNRNKPRLIAMSEPRSMAAEAYRTVRTSVEFLGLDQPIGSLQVTSAIATEGKTTTLANLAVTIARAGQRVIVLCCDMRRPRIHEFFGLENKIGFTSVLLGDAAITDAIQPVPGELSIGVVSSGPIPPNPAELLESRRAVETIEALDNRCDLLLIDSPPILPVTDAMVISGLVDGVLLVADSGSTAKRGLRRAVELLRQVDAPVIGAILNGVASKSEYGYAYANNSYYDYRVKDATEAQAQNGHRRRKKARASR